MVTTAFWVFGYWLIGRLSSARRPSTTTSKLITTASTGRRIKISVNFIGRIPLLFLRRRVRVVGRLNAVVDHHRCVVLELELAAGHYLLTSLQAFGDGDLVTARRSGLDQHLFRDELLAVARRRGFGFRCGLARLRRRRLGLLDHEHGRPVRVVGDRGLRQREPFLDRAGVDAYVGEHAGQEFTLRIGDRGLY